MKVTIDCEICGAEGGIWKGGTIPVACPAECDNGQVTLEGDDATDELERREIAKRKAAERRATQTPATYPGSRLTPEERREIERREIERRAERAQAAAWVVSWRSLVTEASGEGSARFTYEDAAAWCRRENREWPNVAHAPKFVGVAGKSTAPHSAVALLAAEGRSGSLARPASPAAWPFDVALEASRDNRARRMNAHPATVAAFGHLTAKPGRARPTSVGGFEAAPKFAESQDSNGRCRWYVRGTGERCAKRDNGHSTAECSLPQDVPLCQMTRSFAKAKEANDGIRRYFAAPLPKFAAVEALCA